MKKLVNYSLIKNFKNVIFFLNKNKKITPFELRFKLFFRKLFISEPKIEIKESGISESKNLSNYTFGYIDHNKDLQKKYLGPSLEKLKGNFRILNTDSLNCPAVNYNAMIEHCSSPFLILTHQDVTFSEDLLDLIDETIATDKHFGANGMVGADKDGVIRFSNSSTINELDTLDCCFIVINCRSWVRFNSKIFNEFHLYVEDYCAMQRTLGKKIYTIRLKKNSSLNHHSYTWKTQGSCWGNYNYFKTIFSKRWPGLKTT